jgi:thiosulfate/3-mercaptopyruvate sulfurtransferase
MVHKLVSASVLCVALAAPLAAQHDHHHHHHAPAASGVNEHMLVSPGWLAERLQDPAVVVLHVARDEAEFRAGHIPGARWVPLSSIIVEREGIPNELPETEALLEVFARAGISDHTQVVVYGDLGGLSAARAFFTLDYLGHEHVSLLDGGLETWKAEGRALATETLAVQPAAFTPRPRPERVVDAHWVFARLGNPNYALIDARPTPQFTGEDAAGLERAGHIPGASNLFWRTTFRSDDDPRLLGPAELRRMFAAAGAAPGRTVVAYCRTGMQASHAYFVLRYLGYEAVMYDGSFVEWSRLDGMPVAR